MWNIASEILKRILDPFKKNKSQILFMTSKEKLYANKQDIHWNVTI